MAGTSLRRLVAAVLVTAAAGLVVPLVGPAAPASAATCSSPSGVTVIVDFKQLGGGVQGSCVGNGAGQRASSLFPSAGFALNAQTPGNPGYVCQVGGKPAGCTEPDDQAYWGLWWSTGNGTWTYSSYGVSALKVPAGSWVAFAWKQGSGDAPQPGVTPRTPAATTPPPAPAPTQTPTQQPTNPSQPPNQQPTQQPTQQPSNGQATQPSGGQSTQQPTQQPTSPSGQPSTGASSAAPSPTQSASPGASPSATPTTPGASASSATPTDGATASSTDEPTVADPVVADPTEPTAASSSDDGGLPIWVVVLVFLALAAITCVTALARRPRRP